MRILLPLSLVLAVVFLSQGVIDNFHGNTPYKPVDTALVQAKDASGQPTGSAVVPGGPVASQEAIKELGTNGGGFYNANSGHPFENPNGLTNFLQMYFAAPHRLRAHVHVREDGRRQAPGLGRSSR